MWVAPIPGIELHKATADTTKGETQICNLTLFFNRRTAWGVQRAIKWQQVTHPAGGPVLKRP
jgi:hypothetical protein